MGVVKIIIIATASLFAIGYIVKSIIILVKNRGSTKKGEDNK